jgi:peptidoglycan-associated lipoprotein
MGEQAKGSVAAGTRSASVFLLIHEAQLAGKRFLHKGVRGRQMKLKIVTFIAAALLLAGCASDKEMSTTDSSSTGGTSAAPGSVEDFQVNVGDRVFFDYDSYEIRADAQDTLNRQAAWLGQYGNYAITVEGHCDERGTREYNLALGERRANAVRNYLVAQGVDPNRIQTISYGKERPEIADSNESAWAQNRRGVTVLQ